MTVALVYCDSIACVLDFCHRISANKLLRFDSSFAEWRLIRLDCREEMALMTELFQSKIESGACINYWQVRTLSFSAKSM